MLKRADYWKSQARKYCDFCKCWISDNKPSVQFHESGKKHKANVQIRLKEIGKKSNADLKARQKMDDDIKKMEEAAMKAYMKDVEQNLDYSSKLVQNSDDETIKALRKQVQQEKNIKWHQSKADNGEVYYWHSETGEARWDKPAEGFIPHGAGGGSGAKTQKPPKPPKRKFKHKDKDKSERSSDKGDKGEKEKKKRKTENKIEINFGPIISGNPYGTWEKIKDGDQKNVDFQLPKKKPIFNVAAIQEDEGDRFEFKEKSVSTIASFDESKIVNPGTSSSSSFASFQFKKPKINRGNTRQRSDD